jgi:hypothetical protein
MLGSPILGSPVLGSPACSHVQRLGRLFLRTLPSGVLLKEIFQVPSTEKEPIVLLWYSTLKD